MFANQYTYGSIAMDHLIRVQEDLLELTGGTEGHIKAELHRHERKARAFIGDRPALYIQALPLGRVEWRLNYDVVAKATDNLFDYSGPRRNTPNGFRLEARSPEPPPEWRLEINKDGYVSFIYFPRDPDRELKAPDFGAIDAFGAVCDRIPIAQDGEYQREIPYLLRLRFLNSTGFRDVSTAGSVGPADEGPEIDLPDARREKGEKLSEVVRLLSESLKRVLSPAR
jgi:hypothetical protein